MEIALGILMLSCLLLGLTWKKFAFQKISSHHDGMVNSAAWESLEKLASPKSLPIIGNLHHILKADLLQQSQSWVKKYGSIFKLKIFSHTVVYINEPSLIQKVLSSSNPKHLDRNRAIYGAVFTGHLADGLAASGYDIWSGHRRIMNHSFNYQSLQNQLKLINKHAKELVFDILGRNNTTVLKHGVNEMIHYRTMKLVLATIVNMEIFCTEEEQSFLYEQMEINKNIVTYRIMNPWFLIGPLWKIHPLSRKQNSITKLADDFVKAILDKFKSNRKGSRVTAILKNNNKENDARVPDEHDVGRKGNEDAVGAKRNKCMVEQWIEHGMSDKEILDEIITILLGGHETTSQSLTFLLFNLAINADIQEKCREEVDELFKTKMEYLNDDNIQENSSDPDLSINDLSNLKYLERCILENLRLFPILPAVFRQMYAPLKLSDDIVLPKGCSALLVPWTLHRDPSIYPNPEKFLPDRFLSENCKKRHSHSYIPFSAGKRNCIGWKSALIMLKVLTAVILRNFVVETTDRWEDVQIQFKITLSTKEPLNLTFKKRT